MWTYDTGEEGNSLLNTLKGALKWTTLLALLLGLSTTIRAQQGIEAYARQHLFASFGSSAPRTEQKQAGVRKYARTRTVRARTHRSVH